MLPPNEAIAEDLMGFSITSGEVIGSDYVLLALSSDERLRADPEDYHSYLCLISDGKVRLRENVFPITSQTRAGDCDLISLSAQGSVRLTSPHGGENEAMVGDASGQKVYGRTRLTQVSTVDGQAIAVGTRGAVYRRTAPGEWDCIDHGCYDPNQFGRSLNAIAGFGADELYAVGDGGELWMQTRGTWAKAAWPGADDLNTVVCASDGNVYAAGSRGVVVRGRGDHWHRIEGVPGHLTFWGSAWYEATLFLTANLDRCYTLTAEGIVPVDFGDTPAPQTAFDLKVRDNALWLFGPKDVYRLEKGTWTQVVALG